MTAAANEWHAPTPEVTPPSQRDTSVSNGVSLSTPVPASLEVTT